MSWTPPKTWEALTKHLAAELNQELRDNINSLKTNIALEVAVGLVISSGAVIKSQSHHVISAESGTTDDLDTIDGGTQGDVLFVRAFTGHTITLKHGTDNLYNPLEEDVDITDSSYAILVHNGTVWIIFASGVSEEEVIALIAFYAFKLGTPSPITLDSHSFEATLAPYYDLTPEGGDFDILATITGGYSGQIIFLKAATDKTIQIAEWGNIRSQSQYGKYSFTYTDVVMLTRIGFTWQVMNEFQLLDELDMKANSTVLAPSQRSVKTFTQRKAIAYAMLLGGA